MNIIDEIADCLLRPVILVIDEIADCLLRPIVRASELVIQFIVQLMTQQPHFADNAPLFFLDMILGIFLAYGCIRFTIFIMRTIWQAMCSVGQHFIDILQSVRRSFVDVQGADFFGLSNDTQNQCCDDSSQSEYRKKLRNDVSFIEIETIWPSENIRDDVPADVILKVDDKEIHAHKLILAAASPVFHAMFFKSQMRESQESIPKIPVEEASYASLCILVNCCYAKYPRLCFEHLTDVTQLIELLTLFNRYDVEILVHALSVKIYAQITSDKMGTGDIITLLRSMQSPSLQHVQRALLEELLDHRPLQLTADHLTHVDMDTITNLYAL